MATATQQFKQAYGSDPIHSSFGFAVRYMGTSTFRGTLQDASAKLTPADGGLVLEGEAKVESISIREPEQFRQHVLSPDFFDVENHPVVTFRSDDLVLEDDGTATVRGQLTIKGATREVTATGTWTAGVEDPYGNKRGSLDLEADLNRNDFGLDWNAPLPSGGNILAEDVKLNIQLALVGA